MCVNESTFFFFLGYLFFNVQKIYGSILKCLFRAGNMHGNSFNASLLSESFSVLAHRYISLPELSPLKKILYKQEENIEFSLLCSSMGEILDGKYS